MNTEKLQSWISLAANIGVVIGLILLLVELNQTNKQAASTAYQARITEIDNSITEFATSDYLPDIYVKLDQGSLSDLTPSEYLRVSQWETARYMRLQGQFYQYQQGYLDEVSYQALLRQAARYMPLLKELNIFMNNEEFLQAVEQYSKAL